MQAPAPSRPSTREQMWVLIATTLASGLAIAWSWTNSAFLLYGDAEAHIHIARRLFDSHRPGITQLGSVWLPLPHLLMVPFVAIDPWWRSGFGPAIPSALCYILACLGLYKLARKWLSQPAAWLALALFAANPNLLYLQTTAMTEPLFLCELIWSVLLLIDWYERLENDNPRHLWHVIAVLAAAVYTRYDGWILAFLAWTAMAICLYRRKRLMQAQFIAASVVLLLAPAGWMLYNAVVFGDWLDFMRGPYSARAIELRTASSAVDPHPGWHNPWIALKYFAKAAEMDAVMRGSGTYALEFVCLGTLWAWITSVIRPNSQQDGLSARSSKRTWLWTLFFWLPLPFYAYSVSYGSVPIFLPTLQPFSWYNTRYGMEMLPAFALFTGFSLELILTRFPYERLWIRPAICAAIALVIAGNCLQILREGPLTYIEGKKNTEARSYFNTVLPQALSTLLTQDPKATLLMDTSTFASVVPHAGLTYRQTINESDKQFYWAALVAPAAHADIVLAFAGDDIDKAVRQHPEHLRKLQTFHSPFKGWDQADATLYVTDTFPLKSPPQTSTATATQ